MSPELKSILQDQFLNKRINVNIPERDNKGKTIPNKLIQCTGFCTYIGNNDMLNWNLQVTIDRMPINVQHINHISLE